MILKELQNVENVIQLVDIVEEKQSRTPCLVMEYIENEANTKELLQRIESEQLQEYMWEITKTLDIAHSRGVMHRDIKPQNIIINPKT